MKELPILFSGPMVRAILDGRKTQTRRIVKPQSIWEKEIFNPHLLDNGYYGYYDHHYERKCPYGKSGDRMWVREAFDFLPDGGPSNPQACEIVYWATGSRESRIAPSGYNPMIYGHERVRPSIHMPRWASRIDLEITNIRVERLQDISEEDAIAEGIYCDEGGKYRQSEGIGPYVNDPRIAYKWLWESINGLWDLNPWVWVVEFKRINK